MLSEYDIGLLIRTIDRRVSELLQVLSSRIEASLDGKVRTTFDKSGYARVVIYHGGLSCIPSQTAVSDDADEDEDETTVDFHARAYHVTDADDLEIVGRDNLQLPVLLLVAGMDQYPSPDSEPYFEREISLDGNIQEVESKLVEALDALDGFAATAEIEILLALRYHISRTGP